VGPLKFFYKTANCNSANVLELHLSKKDFITGTTNGFTDPGNLVCSFKISGGDLHEKCNVATDNSDADFLIYSLSVDTCTDTTLYEVTVSTMF